MWVPTNKYMVIYIQIPLAHHAQSSIDLLFIEVLKIINGIHVCTLCCKVVDIFICQYESVMQ